MNTFCFPQVRNIDELEVQDYINHQHHALFLKIYLRRADCYMKIEKYEEAVREYEKCQKFKPQDAEINRAIRDSKKALKMSKRKDYYKILCIERTATEVEVKKAYRKLALQFHPDKQSGLTEEERIVAEAKFKEIGEAYSILSDPRKKNMFDNGMDLDGSSSMDGGGVPMDDLFQAFFSRGGHGGFGHGFNGGGFHQHGFGRSGHFGGFSEDF
jgi:DnaJ family protein C protein 7